MTWGTAVVSLILIEVVALIVRSIVVDKKRGRSSCGAGCKACPMSGSCHNHK